MGTERQGERRWMGSPGYSQSLSPGYQGYSQCWSLLWADRDWSGPQQRTPDWMRHQDKRPLGYLDRKADRRSYQEKRPLRYHCFGLEHHSPIQVHDH